MQNWERSETFCWSFLPCLNTSVACYFFISSLMDWLCDVLGLNTWAKASHIFVHQLHFVAIYIPSGMPDWIQCFLKACSLTKSIPQSAFLPSSKNKHLQRNDAASGSFSGKNPIWLVGMMMWLVRGLRILRLKPGAADAPDSSFPLPVWVIPPCLGHRRAGSMQWISALCGGTFCVISISTCLCLLWEPHTFLGLRIAWSQFLVTQCSHERNS